MHTSVLCVEKKEKRGGGSRLSAEQILRSIRGGGGVSWPEINRKKSAKILCCVA